MPMSWEQNSSIVAWNGTGITTQIDAEPFLRAKKSINIPLTIIEFNHGERNQGAPVIDNNSITVTGFWLNEEKVNDEEHKATTLKEKNSPSSYTP